MTGELTSGQSGAACALPGADIYGPAFTPDLPDYCTPLDAPCWVTPPEAVLMCDEDAVLGFEVAGSMWAIPWWVMKNHHVANLTLGGQSCLVTLCEACVAGGVFDPIREGRRWLFQTNGWYRGSPLMTDDQTGSLWAVIEGRCLAGPAAGATLPMRPIVHCRWAEWATMYPRSLVVHGAGEPRDGHGADCSSPDHQHDGHRQLRGLDWSELVVHAELGQDCRAYRLAALHSRGGIVEDSLAGTPIMVVTRPGTWLCVVFISAVDGVPIRLAWDQTEDPPTHLTDLGSGLRFDLWGRCVTDGHREFQLPYVRSSLKKWSRWTHGNPDGELWSAGQEHTAVS